MSYKSLFAGAAVMLFSGFIVGFATNFAEGGPLFCGGLVLLFMAAAVHEKEHDK